MTTKNSRRPQHSVSWSLRRWPNNATINGRHWVHAVWKTRRGWAYSAKKLLLWNLPVSWAAAFIQYDKSHYSVSPSICLIVIRRHSVNSLSDTVAGLKLIYEEFFETDWIKAIPAHTLHSVKNATYMKASIVGTMTYHTRTGDSRARVVFDVAGSLTVSVVQGIAFMEKVVGGIFHLKQRKPSCNSKPIRILGIKTLPRNIRKWMKRHKTWWLERKMPLPCCVSWGKEDTNEIGGSCISHERCKKSYTNRNTTIVLHYLSKEGRLTHS